MPDRHRPVGLVLYDCAVEQPACIIPNPGESLGTAVSGRVADEAEGRAILVAFAANRFAAPRSAHRQANRAIC